MDIIAAYIGYAAAATAYDAAPPAVLSTSGAVPVDVTVKSALNTLNLACALADYATDVPKAVTTDCQNEPSLPECAALATGCLYGGSIKNPFGVAGQNGLNSTSDDPSSPGSTSPAVCGNSATTLHKHGVLTPIEQGECRRLSLLGADCTHYSQTCEQTAWDSHNSCLAKNAGDAACRNYCAKVLEETMKYCAACKGECMFEWYKVRCPSGLKPRKTCEEGCKKYQQ